MVQTIDPTAEAFSRAQTVRRPRSDHGSAVEAHTRAVLAGLEDLVVAEENGTAVKPPREVARMVVPSYSTRPGFSFEVRRMEPEGYEQIAHDHTKQGRPGEMATLDKVGVDIEIIYRATTEEYQDCLWDDPDRQRLYNVHSPYALIRELIPRTGEREAIVMHIAELGGYGRGNRVVFIWDVLQKAEEDLEEALGN